MKKIALEDDPVSLTEALQNPKGNRERTTQIIIFETFNEPATHVATQILTERECSFTAATEREIVQEATKKLCYTGSNYDTDHKILSEREYSFTAAAERETVVDVRKKLYCVGPDYHLGQNDHRQVFCFRMNKNRNIRNLVQDKFFSFDYQRNICNLVRD